MTNKNIKKKEIIEGKQLFDAVGQIIKDKDDNKEERAY